MSETRKKNDGCWIQTYSGGMVWPVATEPGSLRLEDIAHALSLLCRFNGHCKSFYSVAQHSVHVMELVKRRAVYQHTSAKNAVVIARAALLHDAAEAYLGDMVRPLKGVFPGFRETTEHLQYCIVERFCAVPSPEEARTIKICDNQMLAAEARDLMSEPPRPWVELPLPSDWTVVPLAPEEAKKRFRREMLVLWPEGLLEELGEREA